MPTAAGSLPASCRSQHSNSSEGVRRCHTVSVSLLPVLVSGTTVSFKLHSRTNCPTLILTDH